MPPITWDVSPSKSINPSLKSIAASKYSEDGVGFPSVVESVSDCEYAQFEIKLGNHYFMISMEFESEYIDKCRGLTRVSFKERYKEISLFKMTLKNL